MTDAETNVFYIIFYLNNDRITFLLQITIVNIIGLGNRPVCPHRDITFLKMVLSVNQRKFRAIFRAS